MEGCGRTERKSEKMNGEKSKVSVSVAERQHLSCISSTCFCLLLSREIWTLWSLVFKKGKDIFLVYTTSTSAPGPTQWLLVFYWGPLPPEIKPSSRESDHSPVVLYPDYNCVELSLHSCLRVDAHRLLRLAVMHFAAFLTFWLILKPNKCESKFWKFLKFYKYRYFFGVYF